jgi:Ca-activated chloride channel family protein
MKLIRFIIATLFATALVFGDGLLLSKNDDYPGELLRNRVTEVTVKIEGLIAETVVYQEFVNEANFSVDAVYSFPLPADARSTMLLYTRNDTTFEAVLEVRQQATNPGTGDDGIAALINAYIGRNGLKMELQDIAPGAIQIVELRYISLLEYHQGECRYEYPLDTRDFVTYPLDHLEVTIDVHSDNAITDYDLESHPGYQVLVDEADRAVLRLREPNAFTATDVSFYYHAQNDDLDVDFYSLTDPSLGGHFALFVRPENQAADGDVLAKNIVFLLGNSTSMAGYKLDQSIAAISQALDQLDNGDKFNIVLFNSSTERWQPGLVNASAASIANAKTYLSEVTAQFGSRLDLGVQIALGQFQDSDFSNSILAFTDGRSPLDPQLLASVNIYNTGIFPIGIGSDIDYARLEMLADLNYGFTTYFDEDDNLIRGMGEVFEKINQPVLKDVQLLLNKPDAFDLVPAQLPTTFAGDYFFLTGRYDTPGATQLNVLGEGVSGAAQFDYQVDFNGSGADFKAPEKIWAKEKIDALERQILVYGETTALKDTVIALSLRYNMRSRYTAYIADYMNVYTDIGDELIGPPLSPESFILNNYPNPFNPSTKIKFYIDAKAIGAAKYIKIFNVLGQLVHVIDVSQLGQGWHEVTLNGIDLVGNGLASGTYFVALQIDRRFVSTLKIQYIK